MGQLDMFLKQHHEMKEMMQGLRGALKPADSLSSRADAVRSEFSRFVGVLSVHLAMEDKHLYPTLGQDARANVALLAKRFGDEMMPIAAELKAHSGRWHAKAIREDAAGFAASTSQLLDRIEQRMSREESELYPLLR